jgi:hypothetical protein
MHDKFENDRTVQVCTNNNLGDLVLQQVGGKKPAMVLQQFSQSPKYLILEFPIALQN